MYPTIIFLCNRPLDEPKKLKEKFDDIFDAAKYNKASESITKLLKKRNEGDL